MAYDKVVDSTVLDNGLTAIAGAVRTKGGTSAALSFPTGIVNAINALPSGGNAHIVTGATVSGPTASGSYKKLTIILPSGEDPTKVVGIMFSGTMTWSSNYKSLYFMGVGEPYIASGSAPQSNGKCWGDVATVTFMNYNITGQTIEVIMTAPNMTAFSASSVTVVAV